MRAKPPKGLSTGTLGPGIRTLGPVGTEGRLKDTGYQSQLTTKSGTPRRRVEVGFKNLPPEGVRIVPIKKKKPKEKKEKPWQPGVPQGVTVTSLSAASGVWSLGSALEERELLSVAVAGVVTPGVTALIFKLEVLDASGNVLGFSATSNCNANTTYDLAASEGNDTPAVLNSTAGNLITFGVPMRIPAEGSARLKMLGWISSATTPPAFFATRSELPSEK